MLSDHRCYPLIIVANTDEGGRSWKFADGILKSVCLEREIERKGGPWGRGVVFVALKISKCSPEEPLFNTFITCSHI